MWTKRPVHPLMKGVKNNKHLRSFTSAQVASRLAKTYILCGYQTLLSTLLKRRGDDARTDRCPSKPLCGRAEGNSKHSDCSLRCTLKCCRSSILFLCMCTILDIWKGIWRHWLCGKSCIVNRWFDTFQQLWSSHTSAHLNIRRERTDTNWDCCDPQNGKETKNMYNSVLLETFSKSKVWFLFKSQRIILNSNKHFTFIWFRNQRSWGRWCTSNLAKIAYWYCWVRVAECCCLRRWIWLSFFTSAAVTEFQS